MKKFIKDSLAIVKEKSKTDFTITLMRILSIMLFVFIIVCFGLTLCKLVILLIELLFNDVEVIIKTPNAPLDIFKYNIWCDGVGPYETNSFHIENNTVAFYAKETNYTCNSFLIKEIR